MKATYIRHTLEPIVDVELRKHEEESTHIQSRNKCR